MQFYHTRARAFACCKLVNRPAQASVNLASDHCSTEDRIACHIEWQLTVMLLPIRDLTPILYILDWGVDSSARFVNVTVMLLNQRHVHLNQFSEVHEADISSALDGFQWLSMLCWKTTMHVWPGCSTSSVPLSVTRAWPGQRY